MERSLIILKPDAVNRGLCGEIIHVLERKGLKIVAMKMELLKPEKLETHYAHHKDKSFFKDLVRFMSSIPTILMVVEGKDVVEVAKKIVGHTSGRVAEPGTIRGDFSMSTQQNLIHASATVKEAEREIKRFFKEEELHGYMQMNFDWVYSAEER